ncbi:ABC transporter ATP-binding protein [[Clostridium] spiroforme]|nr:ABC transporter ATP-binding protein [Thomasclavelia spiroformis]MBM6880737.1 ABC transporter ATP-binding protein [Thomasclavelia spiroformis]
MDKITIRRLMAYCRPYMRLIYLLMFLSIVSVILTLLTPVLLGQAIDLLIGKGQVDFARLFQKLAVIAFIIVMGALIQWIMGQLTNTITYNITNDLRNRVFDKIQVLPLKYIDGTGHGDILGRLINDIDLIGQGLLQSFTSLLTGIATIAGTILIMAIINLMVALIVIVLTPLSLLVASIIVKRTHSYFQEQLALRGEMNAFAEEMIGNQKIINIFDYQEMNEQKFADINLRMHENGVISQFYGALINPTTRLVNSIVYAAVGVFGALQVLNGAFSVGILSSFLTYANQYTKPFNEISSVMSEMQTALAASQRVFDLLDEVEIQETAVTQPLASIKGDVMIKDLHFRYVENKPLIENFNFTAKPGQTIAIVGKTGCGKTTLINLLMRFYDQQQGHVYIDGTDTLTMKRNDLRKLYGMVLQDSWLFKGTVKENIAYGKADASDEEVIAAAKKARVHKFIMSLPDGYDTMVEEDGGNMSQGQKQLISIARIMLTHPSMLILDEATSSIDTRTELQVQKAFDEMMQGRTTFIVAHRLSTIVNADAIIVMDQGHIVEVGNHQELLKKKGYYHQLYYSQFEQNEKAA